MELIGRKLDTALDKYGKRGALDKVCVTSMAQYTYMIRLSDDPDDVMELNTIGKLTQDELQQLRKYFIWLYRD